MCPPCHGWALFEYAVRTEIINPARSRLGKAKVWIQSSAVGQAAGAVGDFVSNYREMRDANTIGADKYFHCRANCQAAQRGPAGEATAGVVSDAREFVDAKLKGDPDSASKADQAANRAGRAGGRADPNGACVEICLIYRPPALDER